MIYNVGSIHYKLISRLGCMKALKDKFLIQLQIISKLNMMTYLTPFLYGEDALLLRLFLKDVTTPKSIAEVLNITKGRVTAMLNNLKKKHYITTKPSSEDGRSYEIELTIHGRTYIEQKTNFVDNYFNELFNFIGQKDAEKLVDILDNIIEKVNQFEVKNHG